MLFNLILIHINLFCSFSGLSVCLQARSESVAVVVIFYQVATDYGIYNKWYRYVIGGSLSSVFK